jgi:hypothetical protein
MMEETSQASRIFCAVVDELIGQTGTKCFTRISNGVHRRVILYISIKIRKLKLFILSNAKI